MCSWEGLLDLENEKYLVSLSLIWAGPSLFSRSCCYLHLGVSAHRGQTPAAQPGARLSPASPPPQCSQEIEYFITLKCPLCPFPDYPHTCPWSQTITDWLSL